MSLALKTREPSFGCTPRRGAGRATVSEPAKIAVASMTHRRRAAMTPEEFKAALLRDGYSADIREIAPGTATPEHTHPFHVRGMVLEGDITLGTAEGSRTYRPGEVFSMAADHPHTETIGTQGVRNLVGRLQPPAPAG